MQRLRVAFAGTGQFAVAPLGALIASEHELVALYTQPDRRAGRGRRYVPSPIKQCALERLDIPIQQPAILDESVMRALQAQQLDVLIVVDYGALIPPAILQLPRYGCLNIHPSLLPRWRGAAPVQRALLAGDSQTGVCIIQMDAGLDTGDILMCKPCQIDPEVTASALSEQLSHCGGEMLQAVLQQFAQGRAQPQPQLSDGVRYAHKLSREDGPLQWSRTARELHNQVRALVPWPVAETTLGARRVRVWACTVPDGVVVAPGTACGTVIGCDDRGIDVATGHGVLRLLELQHDGARRLACGEFARGSHMAIGQRFG